MEIIPAIIGSSPIEIAQQSLALRGLSNIIHFDVRDGQFVPEASPKDIASFFEAGQKYDIHLMASSPASYMPDLPSPSVRFCFIHSEIKHSKLAEAVASGRDNNLTLGLAINPETSLGQISELERHIKAVLIMAIAPGAAGRAFDERAIARIAYVKEHFNHLYVAVDGGINLDTLPKVRSADGAITHSAIFQPHQSVKQLYQELQRCALMVS